MRDLIPIPEGIDAQTLFFTLVDGTNYKTILWCTKTDKEDKCMEAMRDGDVIEIKMVGKATNGILHKKLVKYIKDKNNYIVKMENLTDVIVVIL